MMVDEMFKDLRSGIYLIPINCRMLIKLSNQTLVVLRLPRYPRPDLKFWDRFHPGVS